MQRGGADEILERLERRALESAAEEILEPEFDLRDALGGADGRAPLPDLTLGGYIAEHDRPPAFTGSDGRPYTIGFDTEETAEPERPYVGFLVFLRWATTGAGIMDHVESGDLVAGATEDEATRALLDLSLYEVKAELDAAIERRRTELEEGC
ncbi:MAG TPA: hypothetical protein VF212_08525 [Longimicrobiales bacterium]